MGDHSDLVVMEVEVEVVDLEEIVEMTAEMTDEEEVVVPASIVIEQGIWQEIVLMVTVGMVAEVEVDLGAEAGVVVAVAGLAITATRKGTWPENAQRVTAETVEADKAISSL